MTRQLLATAVLGLTIGGSAVARGQTPQPSQTASLEKTPPLVRVGEEGIRFDPSACEPSVYSYDYHFGNVRVTVNGIKEGSCTFEYMFEMEGGWSLSSCQLPRSAEEVTVKWTWRTGPNGRGGENYMKTSFVPENCKILKTGSLFFDADED